MLEWDEREEDHSTRPARLLSKWSSSSIRFNPHSNLFNESLVSKIAGLSDYLPQSNSANNARMRRCLYTTAAFFDVRQRRASRF